MLFIEQPADRHALLTFEVVSDYWKTTATATDLRQKGRMLRLCTVVIARACIVVLVRAYQHIILEHCNLVPSYTPLDARVFLSLHRRCAFHLRLVLPGSEVCVLRCHCLSVRPRHRPPAAELWRCLSVGLCSRLHIGPPATVRSPHALHLQN
jgi:hypothetical protein